MSIFWTVVMALSLWSLGIGIGLMVGLYLEQPRQVEPDECMDTATMDALYRDADLSNFPGIFVEIGGPGTAGDKAETYCETCDLVLPPQLAMSVVMRLSAEHAGHVIVLRMLKDGS